MRGKGLVAAVMAAALVCARALRGRSRQVTGLTATQDVGFTTLKWSPVAGATDYQIERTPVDADDQPTGAATVVGVWQPQRTITPDKPAFAESGYTLGGALPVARAGPPRHGQRRSRTRTPVRATTLPIPGPASLLTAWE